MQRTIMLILTLLLSGRAMTIAYLSKAGGTLPGNPPAAWLMPLIGDAIIGISALAIAFLIAKKKGLWVWVSILIWNSIAIWDALSAYIIHTTNPWPEFIMIQTFGASMFFIASFMHLIIISLAFQNEVKSHFLG